MSCIFQWKLQQVLKNLRLTKCCKLSLQMPLDFNSDSSKGEEGVGKEDKGMRQRFDKLSKINVFSKLIINKQEIPVKSLQVTL